MRTGKLPEHTFKRSVLNPIQYRSGDVSLRPGIGRDGAVIGNMVTAMATTAFYYTGNEEYALHNALNNVIAAGGKPYGISTAIMLPEHAEEVTLRNITGNLCKQAASLELDMLGGQTELIPTVSEPTVCITAYGNKIRENQYRDVKPSMDIVMTKWMGLYGASVLAKLRSAELETRYPRSYIQVAQSYFSYMSLMPELNVLERLADEITCRIVAAHDVSNGGVFGALWQLLLACNIGATIELSKIPVKQEVIEVSEYFGLNPYLMNGQGSLLMICENGEFVAEQFRNNGVHAEVIGMTTDANERKVVIGEEERFLGPVKGDALNAVFYGQPIPV